MNDLEAVAQPVLVTGATGFIGQRVVHKLLETNMAVKALVLPEEALPEEWTDRVKVVRGSLTDGAGVREAADGAGTIIHLAAVVSDWGDEKRYWALTVEGSRRVFEQAVEQNARVVLASSIAVYGDNIRKRVCGEDAGYGRTFGPYSRTKQAQEKLAWEYYRQQNMSLTVVRPGNVYGPGSGPWLRDVLPLLRSSAPVLVGGGDMNAGLGYVDNVAEVLLLAGATASAVGRAYNACDGLSVTWRKYFTDLAHMIGASRLKSIPRPAAALGARIGEGVWKLLGIKKRPPLTRDALNLVGSDNRFPNDRMRNELGYTPNVSYEEGMTATKAYIENQLMKEGKTNVFL